MIKNKCLFLVLSLAIIIKVFYLFSYMNLPFFYVPYLDELYHYEFAKSLLKNNFHYNDIFFRAPFFMYFLAIILKISANMFFVRLLLSFIGIINVYLTYKLAHIIFDSKKIACISALCMSTCSLFIFYDAQMLLTSFYTFWLLLSIYYLIKFIKENRNLFLYMGFLFLGFAAITRPNILISVPFIIMYLWIIKKNIHILVSALFLLLPIIPVTYHNYKVKGDFVLISSQGGINFYLGNNPHANGFIPKTSEEYYTYGKYEDSVKLFSEKQILKYINKKTLSNLKPSQISKFWFKKGLYFYYKYPLKALFLFFKKLYLFFSGVEIPNNRNFDFWAEVNPLFRFFYAINSSFLYLIPGFFFLLFFAIKEKDKISIFMLYFIIPYILGIAIFFVCSRYRVPILPFFIIYTVGGIGVFFRYYQKYFWKTFFVLIVFIFISRYDFFKIKRESYRNFAYEYWSLGNAYMQIKDFKKAEQCYIKSLAIDKKFADSFINLGVLYYKKDDIKNAKYFFFMANELRPDDPRILNNIAACYEKDNDLNKAIYYYKKAIEKRKDYYLSYLNLADCFFKKGNVNEAKTFLIRYISYANDDEIRMAKDKYPHLFELLK